MKVSSNRGNFPSLICESLCEYADELQVKHGAFHLKSIYGAGQTKNPKYCFVFMNPTSRNVSAVREWKGLRAPWIGTKQVWSLFQELELLDSKLYKRIIKLKPLEWNDTFATAVYENLAEHSAYITNLAKCTQVDARPLSNSVFKAYLPLFQKEIELINPTHLFTFGNQVSSIVLGKQVSVSQYLHGQSELFQGRYVTHPVFYPVGQGRRNQPLAIRRIRSVF